MSAVRFHRCLRALEPGEDDCVDPVPWIGADSVNRCEDCVVERTAGDVRDEGPLLPYLDALVVWEDADSTTPDPDSAADARVATAETNATVAELSSDLRTDPDQTRPPLAEISVALQTERDTGRIPTESIGAASRTSENSSSTTSSCEGTISTFQLESDAEEEARNKEVDDGPGRDEQRNEGDDHDELNGAATAENVSHEEHSLKISPASSDYASSGTQPSDSNSNPGTQSLEEEKHSIDEANGLDAYLSDRHWDTPSEASSDTSVIIWHASVTARDSTTRTDGDEADGPTVDSSVVTGEGDEDEEDENKENVPPRELGAIQASARLLEALGGMGNEEDAMPLAGPRSSNALPSHDTESASDPGVSSRSSSPLPYEQEEGLTEDSEANSCPAKVNSGNVREHGTSPATLSSRQDGSAAKHHASDSSMKENIPSQVLRPKDKNALIRPSSRSRTRSKPAGQGSQKQTGAHGQNQDQGLGHGISRARRDSGLMERPRLSIWRDEVEDKTANSE
ncbi:MAG: hypothetical protein M1817_006042 [Caeruleum heppii]|nr:MAG: hypothetical protein M1817_006042 [Caeruleum heppii]